MSNYTSEAQEIVQALKDAETIQRILKNDEGFEVSIQDVLAAKQLVEIRKGNDELDSIDSRLLRIESYIDKLKS